MEGREEVKMKKEKKKNGIREKGMLTEERKSVINLILLN